MDCSLPTQPQASPLTLPVHPPSLLPAAGYDPAELFTTDAEATPLRVVQWGFLG